MDLVSFLVEATEVCQAIPAGVKDLIATVVLAIKIVVPVLLIIFGMLDLGKAVVAQKDDEIKAGQKTLMNRAIAAAIVFFVITIVQLLMNIVSGIGTGENNEGIWDCACELVNGAGNCKK